MLKLIKSALLAAALLAPTAATVAQAAPAAAPAAAPEKAKCDKDACKNAYEVKVTGMMCAACEAKVKKAFEGVEGVKSAKACHKGGTVSVMMEDKKELTKEAAEKALVNLKEFKVTDVEKCKAKKCKKCPVKKPADK